MGERQAARGKRRASEPYGLWGLAQIDYRQQNLVFGAPCENQQVVLTEYENGVFGLIMGGAGAEVAYRSRFSQARSAALNVTSNAAKELFISSNVSGPIMAKICNG